MSILVASCVPFPEWDRPPPLPPPPRNIAAFDGKWTQIWNDVDTNAIHQFEKLIRR